MIRLALLTTLCAGAPAHADLLGVAASPLGERKYYRISTEDGSAELIGVYDQISLGLVALGPDDRHYAISNHFHVERVDPFTGASTFLHDFSDLFPSGALAVSPDGILYTGWFTYAGAELKAWDIYEDEWAGGVAPENDFAARAAHFRSDGELVATQNDDDYLHTIDLATGEVKPVAWLGLGIQTVFDFATDPRTGLDYMIVEDWYNTRSLWRVDLYTFERTLIAELPDSLQVYGIAGITLCPADFDEDGDLDLADFVAFQFAFQAGEMTADANADGVLNVLDFVAFQALFQEGCP